jgi:hypothetical protein
MVTDGGDSIFTVKLTQSLMRSQNFRVFIYNEMRDWEKVSKQIGEE